MMHVLFDTNILLDVILNRPLVVDDSDRLWELHRRRQIAGWLSAFSIPTLFYVIRRHLGSADALRAIDDCLSIFNVADTTRLMIDQARVLSGPDFEDCLQVATAMTASLNAIVTRDPSGFRYSPVPVYSPLEFLTFFSPSES